MSNFMEFSCDIDSAYDSDVSENQPQTILLSCGYLTKNYNRDNFQYYTYKYS